MKQFRELSYFDNSIHEFMIQSMSKYSAHFNITWKRSTYSILMQRTPQIPLMKMLFKWTYKWSEILNILGICTVCDIISTEVCHSFCVVSSTISSRRMKFPQVNKNRTMFSHMETELIPTLFQIKYMHW